ncbi:hypothetical protein PBAL39_08065 [Pedobacter sp. BAL39]|nr:hypothetical protein PBAL39_08065 [Pedobacter sp. BAL39]
MPRVSMVSIVLISISYTLNFAISLSEEPFQCE